MQSAPRHDLSRLPQLVLRQRAFSLRWLAPGGALLVLLFGACSSRPPESSVQNSNQGGSATGLGTGGSTGLTGAGSGLGAGPGNAAVGGSGSPAGGGGAGRAGSGGSGASPPVGGDSSVSGSSAGGASPSSGGAGSPSGGASSTGGVAVDGVAGMVAQNDPSCTSGFPPPEDPAFERFHRLVENDADAQAKYGAMTLTEKLDVLSGGPTCAYPDGTCFQARGVARAAVNYPTFKMRDAPRGVRGVVGEKSTTFAVPEARAASFDLDLEFRVGKVMASELRGMRADLSLAPTINVLRHPAWARAQETYGEDPVLVGEMGAAYVRGHQDGPGGMPACPKHFAGNNTDENRGGGNRAGVNVIMDERTLRENYARNFQIVVEKGDPACIMAAYNSVNDQASSENAHLLTDLLRSAPSSAQRGWAWTGFVVSDWTATLGVGHGLASITAGLDLEMPTNAAFAELGAAQTMQIERAARRVLNARGTFGQLSAAYITQHGQAQSTTFASDATHIALAQETAEKGAVLLKNSGLLPLGKTVGMLGTAAVSSIVVLGPDRNLPTANTTLGAHGLGDRGSSNTNPPHAVSFLSGIKARATGITVTDSANAADAVGKTVAIIPVTMAHEDEGEAYGGGGDRDTLTLSTTEPRHWTQKPTAFINAVRAADPNVKIVVLLAVGSAIVMEDWINSADAIVQTFYPGQEGGTAAARLLFGDLNFSGKLPFTVAKNPAVEGGDYGNFGNKATSFTVDYLHGYRRFEANNLTPRFWFGHGLSYTTYAYSDLKVLCGSGIGASGRLNVEVTVTNTGMMAGDEVVQLYVGYPGGLTPAAPRKELKAFTRVNLTPGQAKVVQLAVPARDLRHWGATGWQLATGTHTVYVGPSADPMNTNLLAAPFTAN